MENELRYQEAKQVTLIGALVNALLAILKVIFGWFGHSSALFADGIHSFSDLLTDALVLIASRFGSRRADHDHPYGHHRIETAATLALAMLLILAGVGIMVDGVEHLIHKSFEHPAYYVLIIAFLSILANEGLYHYTKRVGIRIKSALITANAWHHRSDAASSVVVFIGVAGAMLGFHYLDAVAAIIVGIMIVKMGWSLGWSSVRELVDTGVDEETLAKIRQTIEQTSGVITCHQLRTRHMADNVLVDVHVLVGPDLSVSEGHYIADLVQYRLRKNVEHISDVTVHIDPENDELVAPNKDLPPRDDIIPQLMYAWRNCPGVEQIVKVQLHYLNGKIQVDLHMPLAFAVSEIDLTDMQEQYIIAARQVDKVSHVKMLFVAGA